MSENIALISPIKPYYSETFIQAHIDLLPFEVHHFYSLPKMGYFPIFNPESKPLFTSLKPILWLEGGLDIAMGRNSKAFGFRKKALKEEFISRNISCVLAEYGPTGAYVMDVCAATDIPLIVHFHGRDAYLYKNLKTYKRRYINMFEMASGIVAVSQDMRKQLISLGCSPDKIVVTPCGPNPDLFDFRETSSNKNQLVSVGRFCDKKSPINTIKAFQKALKMNPDLNLVMIGDGELLELSKNYVLENGLGDLVEFKGSLAHSEILEYLGNSKAFIQHSVRAEDGDSEGMPVSISEAMLVGLPIISTFHAGIPDVVEHQVHGYLSKEHDIDKMAEGIAWVFENEERRQNLGRMAHERIKSAFSMKHHIDALSDLINKQKKGSL